MKNILQSYLRRLTNLSGNSRSILLPKLLSDQFIDIHEFNFALNQPSFQIIEDILARKPKIPICDRLDSRDQTTNKLSTRLNKLKRIDHLIFEERGARDLYLGWPFVKGKFNDGTLVRCPLMFFPIELGADDKQWSIKLRKDVNITMNKSFILAYAYFNELKVNENLLERVFDDFDRDSTGFRTDLYELLKSENLEVHFNQDNFQDELQSFKEYKRVDLETMERDGQLKLFPEAVIGIFPQAGSYLVPDYMRMLEDPNLTSMENFFMDRNLDDTDEDTSSYYRFLKRVKEDQTFTPFIKDAYQENAIKAIKKGNSVVVQGPPGTGKSQMICNLVSDYIARGKNVLVVSQKRAALDVVFNRLKEKQLGDFIGLLHDFKNDRKPIFEQMEGQINRLQDYMGMNNSIDALQIERSFTKTSRRIDQLEEELEEFKNVLFDDQECGLSVKELYLTSSPDAAAFPLNLEYRNLHFDTVDEFVKKLKAYGLYAEKFINENYVWYKRLSFAKYNATDLNAMLKELSEIEPYINVFETVTEKAIGKKVQFEDVVEIIQKEEEIGYLAVLLKEEKSYRGVLKMLQFTDVAKEITKEKLTEREQVILQFYKDHGPEMSISTSELGRCQEVLERGINARGNFLKWFWWKFFSKDKIFITRVLVANKLKSNKEGFNLLVKKVDYRLNLEHNLTQLRKTKGLMDLPESLGRIEILNWFFYQKQAIEARDLLSGVRHMTEYLSPASFTSETYVEKLHLLLESLKPISEKLNDWRKYYSIPQLREIFSKQMEISKMISVLRKDFDSLIEFDGIQESLSTDERRIIDKIVEVQPQPNVEEWLKLFENSLKLAWIDHIELKYPILRSVCSQKFEQMQSELQDCVLEKLKLSNEILLIKSRERVYKNAEYNRLNNMVTYRELHHQITKKRRVWPVRKLISNFPREIFDLIPCWLASPESVSAIFPMEKDFDLVIFDEASQCFVEKGLPAIYRGKQVVIAGDSKQLQPNELYQVRWEEDNDDEIPELDFDSLLNLASNHLMQVELSGHYRSKNLDLIRFSNEHFYQNRLSMLPDFNEINLGEKAIEYIHVNGVWEKNKNNIEAEEVAQLIHKLLKKRPTVEIGVVTFNVQQQMNIIDYLENFSVANQLILPESLIVKNIENIQGDEKDVIIFSTVYAPDATGKMNMNFGSLNMPGGENRLNVAITRAREKIFLVSSIMPQQLRVDDAKNEGPGMLKKYLEYAWNISKGKGEKYIAKDVDHSQFWYLKNKIIAMNRESFENIEVDTSMPYVDIAIKQGNQFLAAIITDDQLYYQDISIKASHVYKHLVLKQKNWNYATIYSRQLWLNPEHVEEQINRLISRNLPE